MTGPSVAETKRRHSGPPTPGCARAAQEEGRRESRSARKGRAALKADDPEMTDCPRPYGRSNQAAPVALKPPSRQVLPLECGRTPPTEKAPSCKRFYPLTLQRLQHRISLTSGNSR